MSTTDILNTQAQPTPDRPLGSRDSASKGPLIAAWALFVLWMLFLIALALRYPSRG